MNFVPRYLGRGSWLARRDPRVLILVVVLFVFTVIQVWDGRVALLLLLLALAYYSSAGIPFRAVRRNWAFVFVFITVLVIVNTIITGGNVSDIPSQNLHVYFSIPVLGTPVSAESVSYGLTQLTRFVAMATVGFPLAFAMAPSDFGVAFARLGVPEKFAYAIDLTFRFIPTLAADMQMTIDAQRLRGYEFQRSGGGPFERVRRMAAIIVPTVISSIAAAEDTIDAMDLRAFGTGRRTWLRELAFERTDLLMLGAFAALLVLVTGFTLAGWIRFYVWPFLIPG